MNLKTLSVLASVLVTGAHAQSVLSGKIVSGTGEPVPYVSVGITKTQYSTVTDINGLYSIKNIANGKYLFTVKGLGYSDYVDTVIINGNTIRNAVMHPSAKSLDEVVVNATRVNNANGMAYSNVDGETLKKQNLGQDAPYMLAQLPSVVVNSDAGNGVGYTGMRIRGTDGTRINVTINGVPVNDAESQGTFFVDMPDLVSSVNNIQVQRGVGASSNGAGAFGASINFQTNQLHEKAYANVISTAGSYHTFRNTLAAGTGLLNNHFTLDARASAIQSNGYIDRARSSLQSYYVAGGYYGKKAVLKFINFSGWEKTYQAWNLVPEDSIRNGNRTYNEIGAYIGTDGKMHYYPNETDNYTQNNSQLHFIYKAGPRLSFNVTGHYTKGKGYYEQYKQGEYLADYQVKDVITGKGDTLSTSDLVRRLWLDNDFAGGIFNVNYKAGNRLDFTLGGGYNAYFGKHFGNLVWARNASDIQPDYQYYMNTANKNDGNVYLKTNFRATSKLNVFVDLQSRYVDYRFLGLNDSLIERTQNKSYLFFNPKAGVSFDVSQHVNVYASVAVGHKEPNRDDFVQNKPSRRPRPEQLTDMEAGIKYITQKLNVAMNFYDMQYKNQLVLNGQVNYVGSPVRVNVPVSYRRGIELEAQAALNKKISIGGNLTLSSNKVVHFIEYIDSSYATADDYITYEHTNTYKNTDIAMSPNLISSAFFTVKPLKKLEVTFINKYVGRQYLDNTGNSNRSINPYNVVDARINYSLTTKSIPEVSFMLAVYNLFSLKYETNGYTFSYYSDGALTTVNYKAPAAPLNFLGGVNIRF
jgi:iron complex outermembrane receptor protein